MDTVILSLNEIQKANELILTVKPDFGREVDFQCFNNISLAFESIGAMRNSLFKCSIILYAKDKTGSTKEIIRVNKLWIEVDSNYEYDEEYAEPSDKPKIFKF